MDENGYYNYETGTWDDDLWDAGQWDVPWPAEEDEADR